MSVRQNRYTDGIYMSDVFYAVQPMVCSLAALVVSISIFPVFLPLDIQWVRIKRVDLEIFLNHIDMGNVLGLTGHFAFDSHYTLSLLVNSVSHVLDWHCPVA